MRKDYFIAVASDLHSGSSVGLLPPSWELEGGGTYTQGVGQRKLWAQWAENWHQVKQNRKKRKLIVVMLGDMIDGNHHGTTQLVTPNTVEHKAIARSCIGKALGISDFDHGKGDLLYFVRGTEVHVGGAEEEIARSFVDGKDKFYVPPVQAPTAAKDFEDGHFLRSILKLNINGVRFNFAHEPGTGGGTRAWTKGNTWQALMRSIYFTAAEQKRSLPNYWVRAHKHQYLHRHHEGDYGRIDGIITPAFQTRTHWVNQKINNDTISDMGMVYFNVDGDGAHNFEPHKSKFEETEYEVL